MKKLVKVEEVDNEGFLGLLGQDVIIFCMNYIYAGVLVGVNDTFVKLDNAHIVYATGDFNSKNYSDAQRIAKEFFIQLNSVESFGKTEKEL